MRGYWVTFIVRVTIELELPALHLVLLGTVMELTILVGEIPTGVVADVYSRKWSVVISYVLVGLAIAASGMVSSFALLVPTQILWGLGWTFQSGAETAWVTDEVGSASAVEPLLLRRARLQHVAGVMGMGGGVAIALASSLATAIVVLGVLVTAWGLFLAVVMPEHGFVRVRSNTYRQFLGILRDGASATAQSGALRVLVAVMLLMGLASEAVDRLDIRRLDQVGLADNYNEVALVGVIGSLEAVVAGLLLWAVERRIRGPAVVPALVMLLTGTTLGVLLLGQVTVLTVAAIGLILQAALRTVAEPVMINWANAHAPATARATVLSFVGQAEATGEIAGGIGLGAVAAGASVSTAMLCSAALFGLGALVSTRGRAAWTAAAVR